MDKLEKKRQAYLNELIYWLNQYTADLIVAVDEGGVTSVYDVDDLSINGTAVQINVK